MGTKPTYEELRSAFNDYATCLGAEKMTFEEWIKDQPDGYYSNDAIFRAGAASRDAEFARLRAINSKLCEKSNWYVIHTARLEEERDQLRAQINVLREALEYCVTQVGELATVPGIASALSSTSEQSLAEYRNKAADRIEELERDRDEWNTAYTSAAEAAFRLSLERDQLRDEIAELVAVLKPFGAIDLVESRLPAEFAMLILRARAAIAKVRKP